MLTIHYLPGISHCGNFGMVCGDTANVITHIKSCVNGWLVAWLVKRPLSAKNRLYQGQGLGWRMEI